MWVESVGFFGGYSSTDRGVPRQQLIDLLQGVIGDSSQHVSQERFRIDTVELCGSDQAVHCGGTFPASIGATKQKILAANRNGT